jgi:DNA gyrase subunit A
MRSAYLSYAMSVITARALPDVRDGLKPVQRRILYAMHEMGLRHDQPTRKCARIVGEVLGKYHPHSDSPVYEALVRMAQDFSMRYILVEGQGNFGSVDGDGAAAYRYTEARLSALGEEVLADLDKDTVDFAPNFDGSLQEPLALPAKLPNLLVNGAGGIAVGMATNIPPHNLGEIADAIAYLIDHYDAAEDITVDDLMQFVKGPDFPTGATVLGRDGIRQAYATGIGRVVMRAQAHVEELRGGHAAIIVTEIPYQVNKASLVERIADLAREGRIEGIGDLRDESDRRTGMRVVVELKRGVEANPLLGQLLKYTTMQTTFGVNMLALVNGEPRVLPLKRILVYYVEHRHEVLVRRTRYELAKAEARAHILQGLLLALDHLDEVIQIIRRSRTAETAQQNLIARFKFSEVQARAILDMQLRRLAAMERKKIEDEYQELLRQIEYLKGLLSSKAKVLALIKQDVLDLKARYGDARRTRISDVAETDEFRAEDLVPDEEALVLLTRQGTVRRFGSHHLGTGEPGALEAILAGIATQEHDGVLAILAANARQTLVFLTTKGRAVRVPTHQIPDATQQAKGLPLRNLAPLGDDEQPVTVVAVEEFGEDAFLALATRQGKVKRLALSELAAMGNAGAPALGLADEGDALVAAALTAGQEELLFVSAQGRAIRFAEDDVRPQGRSGTGVRAIALGDGDELVAMEVVRAGAEVVLATAQGYAKRTPVEEYTAQGRGGLGILAVDTDKLAATGPLVGALVTMPQERLVLSSAAGNAVAVAVASVPALARATWGRLVTRSRAGALVKLEEGDALVGLVRLVGVVTPAASVPTPTAPKRGVPKPTVPAQLPLVAEPPSPKARATKKAPAAEATPAPPARPSRAKTEPPASHEEAKPPAKRKPAAPAQEPAPPPARSGKGKATEAEPPAPPSKGPGARTRRSTVTTPPQRGRTKPSKG